MKKLILSYFAVCFGLWLTIAIAYGVNFVGGYGIFKEVQKKRNPYSYKYYCLARTLELDASALSNYKEYYGNQVLQPCSIYRSFTYLSLFGDYHQYKKGGVHTFARCLDKKGNVKNSKKIKNYSLDKYSHWEQDDSCEDIYLNVIEQSSDKR